MKKTLLAVDGMAFVFRSFYAIAPMISPTGLPTNAIFGFARILQKMFAEINPDYFVVAFDTKEPTFRHKQFPAYKAQRPKPPEELIAQIPWIKKYVQTLGIKTIEMPGFEADDILGTLAVQATALDVNTLIASPDKDLCQLVNDHVAILIATFAHNTVLDAQAVCTKFGVRPDQIVDYLAMVGDVSDNLPGIAGVGPKTAAKLLNQFETLDNILLNSDSIKGKLGERINNYKLADKSFINLLEVFTEVPFETKIEQLVPADIDYAKLNDLRAELGFQKAKKSSAPVNRTPSQPSLF